VTSKTWLLLDTTYLGARASHTVGLGNLSFRGEPTGVIFGVLRDLLNLQEEHRTPHVAFAFDRKPYKRATAYPNYKNEDALKHLTAFRKQQRRERRDQLDCLRTTALPAAGFRNVFGFEGYEADDVLAKLCDRVPIGDRAVLVSEDKDLYQLLSDQVMLWKPHSKRFYTEEDFVRDWGIHPRQWVHVKAIAGCPTDCIGGVAGVGEVTAAKYLRDDLSHTSASYQRIRDQEAKWRRNVPLVELPYRGMPALPALAEEDRLTAESWRAVCQRYGLSSLENRTPFGGFPCTN
jgi:DNA polymerase I